MYKKECIGYNGEIKSHYYVTNKKESVLCPKCFAKHRIDILVDKLIDKVFGKKGSGKNG